MASLSKSDIEKLIRNRDPSVSYAKPKKAFSEHWNNYSQVFVNGIPQHYICCSNCENLLAWKTGDGSTNLKKHSQYCRDKSPGNQQLVTKFMSSNNGNNERLIRMIKKNLITAAAEFCAIDNRPFSLIQGNGFQHLANAIYGARRALSAFNPIESLLPDRTTISREIDRIFFEDRAKLINLIQSVKQYFITIDFWTEPYTKIGYGGLSIHYFDDKFGLNVFILCCKAYKLPNQQANNVRLFTENILRSFSLELDKNTFIVCDNENKMRAAFRHGAVRVGCSAHFLNKIVEHSLTLPTIGCDDIQMMFNNVQDLVSYLRRSHNQSKLSKRLQLFTKTRWNSGYSMIYSFITVYPELSGVVKDPEQKHKLAAIDYDVLLEFSNYFKYFVKVTEVLSADKHPTIHLVLPLKQWLINLSKPNAHDSAAIASLKKYMHREIASYWELEDVHFMAVILQPNFKYLHVCPAVKDKCYNLLNDEIERRRAESRSSYASSSLSYPTTTSQQTTEENDADIIESCFDLEQSQTRQQHMNDEFESYLNEETKLKRNDDLFQYWIQRQQKFPILYSIAKDILTIPATNTCVERLFSASGAAATESRTRLSADKLDKLMFLKKNHLALKFITNSTSPETNTTASASYDELSINERSKDLLDHQKNNTIEEQTDEANNDDDYFF
ncbi:unnamed protein product [Rotaria sp. Silwood1]|nr:unnamed protein product [Rotaria sp. Silwood1]CAF1682413.1 unnamed protein product [Rotaria sp. Silwood1]